MPSNNELKASIKTEAEAKGVDVPVTEGKNNAELADILKGLKLSVPSTDADKEAADKEAADKEAAKKRPPFYIAENKSVTSRKGTLNEGDEIKAEYLGGGKQSLDAHIKAGNVLKG